MRLLIVLALLGAACGQPKLDTRIVGGQISSIENSPYIASLLHGYFGIFFSHQCGGTLLSNNAVLSAAHCFSDRSVSAWRVRLGSSLTSLGGSEHEVSSLIIHPDYAPRLILHNVAVVRLAKPTEFSDRINRAFIAGPNYILPDNTGLSASGWGANQFQGQISEVLHQVDVNLINQQSCVERYAKLKEIPGKENWPDVTPEMMCTGALNVGNKGSCKGDEGGPVIHGGNVVVGIISWGFECGQNSYPSVNVRVSSYANWIFNAAS
ncbi:trypsin, alkaline C-like [Danaus plexippus]|uniref:trypsin, alkaline C-like n=1 Tax=Danaus plexippus TaxID=13037 RepID=UPI002AB05E40|nr:trypsin, alkaline C-like [Danaus plexippus]